MRLDDGQSRSAPPSMPGAGALVLGVITGLLFGAPTLAAESGERSAARRDQDDSPRIPCPEATDADEAWLERARGGVERGVCVSAWRFDSLFGNREDEELGEARSAYGRLRGGLIWDERDGLDPEFRLRATVPLPLMQNRLRAVVGRETDEEFIEDASREFAGDPLLGDESDPSWLVGLGYDPIRGRNSRLSLGTGIKLQTPLNPYVKAAYRYHYQASDTVLLRAQETLFWENEEGFGASTRLTADRLLAEDRLLRWNNYLKVTEQTDGLYWNSNLTLFQHLGEMRAVALKAGVRGETGRDYGPVEYQLRAIYRRPFLRDWLFVELDAGGRWLRDERDAPREFIPFAGIVFEMVFGRHPMLERGRNAGGDAD